MWEPEDYRMTAASKATPCGSCMAATNRARNALSGDGPSPCNGFLVIRTRKPTRRAAGRTSRRHTYSAIAPGTKGEPMATATTVKRCINCGRSGGEFRRGRCNGCRRYVRRHGVERPPPLEDRRAARDLHTKVGVCVNCGRSECNFIRERCPACYGYFHTHGFDRPSTIPPGFRWGADNPSWKGAAAPPDTKRGRARRLYALGPCERCSAPGYDRHHKDGDTGNNEPDNVEILCRRCHMQEDGRLAAFAEAWRRSPTSRRTPSKPCRICGREAKPLRRGRCNLCSDYFRHHGKERPPSLWWRPPARRGKYAKCKPHRCMICQRSPAMAPVYGKRRCQACYQFKRYHGHDKPRTWPTIEQLTPPDPPRDASRRGSAR
jgi:hypothetical protein